MGRRFNLDPVDQISLSNYSVFKNNPIYITDVLGNDGKTAAAVAIATQEAAGAAAGSVFLAPAAPVIEVVGDAIALYELLVDAPMQVKKAPPASPPIHTANAEQVANKTEEGKTTVAPKSKTRREAITKAKNHAQVPGDKVHKGGGEDIPMDDLNEGSRGRNWEEMKKNGAKRLGRKMEKGRGVNEWMEHPDGHPDAGQDGIPEHHGGGHVHATSPQGVKIVYPY